MLKSKSASSSRQFDKRPSSTPKLKISQVQPYNGPTNSENPDNVLTGWGDSNSPKDTETALDILCSGTLNNMLTRKPKTKASASSIKVITDEVKTSQRLHTKGSVEEDENRKLEIKTNNIAKRTTPTNRRSDKANTIVVNIPQRGVGKHSTRTNSQTLSNLPQTISTSQILTNPQSSNNFEQATPAAQRSPTVKLSQLSQTLTQLQLTLTPKTVPNIMNSTSRSNSGTKRITTLMGIQSKKHLRLVKLNKDQLSVHRKDESFEVDPENNRLRESSEMGSRSPENGEGLKSIVLSKIFNMMECQEAAEPSPSKCLTPLPLFRPTLRTKRTHLEKKELCSYYLAGGQGSYLGDSDSLDHANREMLRRHDGKSDIMARQSNEAIKKWHVEYKEGRLSTDDGRSSTQKSIINEKASKIIYKKMFKRVLGAAAQNKSGEQDNKSPGKVQYSLGANQNFKLGRVDNEWGIDGSIVIRHVRDAKDSKSIELAKNTIKESLYNKFNVIKDTNTLNSKRKSVQSIRTVL